MTEYEATRLMEEWQQRLRLQDWDIYVSVERVFDMEQGKNGHIYILDTNRVAFVELLDRADLNPKYADKNDSEVTIVHELLHIFVEPLGIPQSGLKYVAAEQMIQTLASALVALKRAALPAGTPGKGAQ